MNIEIFWQQAKALAPGKDIAVSAAMAELWQGETLAVWTICAAGGSECTGRTPALCLLKFRLRLNLERRVRERSRRVMTPGQRESA